MGSAAMQRFFENGNLVPKGGVGGRELITHRQAEKLRRSKSAGKVGVRAHGSREAGHREKEQARVVEVALRSRGKSR